MTKAIRWSDDELNTHLARRAKPAPAAPAAKPNKYAAQKVERDGVKFDSRKEARRWAELEARAAAGEIRDLRRQVKFELIPPQRRDDGVAERACAYIADFVYIQDGKSVVADAKGIKTKDYIIKRKLLLFIHGISIKEI